MLDLTRQAPILHLEIRTTNQDQEIFPCLRWSILLQLQLDPGRTPWATKAAQTMKSSIRAIQHSRDRSLPGRFEDETVRTNVVSQYRPLRGWKLRKQRTSKSSMKRSSRLVIFASQLEVALFPIHELFRSLLPSGTQKRSTSNQFRVKIVRNRKEEHL